MATIGGKTPSRDAALAMIAQVERQAGVIARRYAEDDAILDRFSDFRAFIIRRTDLQALLQKNIDLCFKFMSVLCERVRWTSGLLEDASLLDLPARLAKRLLNLAQGVGEKEGQGIRINVKLSQTDLGNMLGVTREAVNKQLREWKKDGLVDMQDGHVLIQDPKMLARLVGR